MGFVRRAALDWRVAARDWAEEAAVEAAAAAARRSGSGMRARVVGEGRSLGSARVGSGSGDEGIFRFSFFLFALLGVRFLFRGDGLLDGMV